MVSDMLMAKKCEFPLHSNSTPKLTLRKFNQDISKQVRNDPEKEDLNDQSGGSDLAYSPYFVKEKTHEHGYDKCIYYLRAFTPKGEQFV